VKSTSKGPIFQGEAAKRVPGLKRGGKFGPVRVFAGGRLLLGMLKLGRKVGGRSLIFGAKKLRLKGRKSYRRRVVCKRGKRSTRGKGRRQMGGTKKKATLAGAAGGKNAQTRGS